MCLATIKQKACSSDLTDLSLQIIFPSQQLSSTTLTALEREHSCSRKPLQYAKKAKGESVRSSRFLSAHHYNMHLHNKALGNEASAKSVTHEGMLYKSKLEQKHQWW